MRCENGLKFPKMAAEILEKPHIDYALVAGRRNLPFFGVRHLQVLLLFFMVFIALGSNVCLSVAIVAMTDSLASSNPNVPTYNLEDQGTILSAFFWGYIWPQILAGYVANRFGAKRCLVGAMSLQSALTLFLPVTAANFGSSGLYASRFLQGFCQGFLFPSLTHQLGQWAPLEERSRMGAFAFGVGPLGTVVAMLATGIISASWQGWPLVFYAYGTLGVIWSLMFGILGSNRPAAHPRISEAERTFIETSLGHVGGKVNGLLCALPYLTLWVWSFVFSYASDSLINQHVVKVGTARKIFNSIGLLTSGLALIALGLTKADQVAQAVALLVLAVGSHAACMSGWSVNHIDLSPNFAGTIMGLTNGFAHISAIIAPLIVQFCVFDQTDPEQWRMIFFIAAAVAAVAAAVFVLFGSGDTQDWNQHRTEKIPMKKNELI
uniref:Putative inorganic phosphate cotransporter n=1 Tax=Dendroctonus ponderosae TaxID=77166 RepID=A0AAR5P0Z9_DENPD